MIFDGLGYLKGRGSTKKGRGEAFGVWKDKSRSRVIGQKKKRMNPPELTGGRP